MNIRAGQKLTSVISTKGQFDIVSLSNELIPGTLRAMREFFLYQPFCAAFKIDNKSVVDLERMCLHLATDGVSLAAVDKNTGVLAASLINYIHLQSRGERCSSFFDNYAQNHTKHDSSKALLNFFTDMEKPFDVFEHFNEDCIFETMLGSTLPEYRGVGLMKILKSETVELAKGLKTGKYIRTPLEVNHENEKIVSQSKEKKIPQALIGYSLHDTITKIEIDLNFKPLAKLNPENFKIVDETVVNRLVKKGQPIVVLGMKL